MLHILKYQDKLALIIRKTVGLDSQSVQEGILCDRVQDAVLKHINYIVASHLLYKFFLVKFACEEHELACVEF
jgi:hypothetical protein